MPRFKLISSSSAPTPRFVVLWDLQWQIIHYERIERHCDAPAAMTAAIQRLEAEGWEAEGDDAYGFVFVRRGRERRMLALTPRDPSDSSRQSFDPFAE